MGTTTNRANHAVTDTYTDIITSIAGAASVAGNVNNLGDAEMEMVKGGATAPDAGVRGKPLLPWGSDYVEADHIWIRCRRSGASGVVGFEAFD